jgi:hypothetical protein
MRLTLILAIGLLPWHWHRHHAPKLKIETPPQIFVCSPELDYWDATDCAKRLNRVT